jgi:DNA-directed RNA polymerase subunit beta'
MLNQALPTELRKDQHDLDKKGVHKLLQVVAEKHPDAYKNVVKTLNDVGREAAWTEGVSVSLSGLRTSKAKQVVMAELNQKLDAIREDDSLTDEQRSDAIVELLVPYSGKIADAVVEEAKQEGNNPFYLQVNSGARGKKTEMSSLRGADLLVENQHGKFVPIPITSSYAEGFKPAEYFAASYGQRKGMIGTKLAVADSGYGTKMLVNAAHRLVVTRESPDQSRLPIGLPTDVSDKELVGQVLAHDAGPYKAGTVITKSVQDELQEADIDQVLTHSPMTELTPDGGISRLAAGKRHRTGLTRIGDNVGIASGHAIGEKWSQSTLNAKHSSGVKDRVSRSGVDYIFRLLGAPEHFPEAGPLAEADGHVEDVRQAEQGGHYVKVAGKDYYLNPGLTPTVKKGDTIEAGDDLSDGVPHPQQLVKLRGMGEARRVYANALHEAFNESGVEASKRNVQAVVAGLLNWAKVTNPDGIGDNVVDDIAPFNRLVYNYKPRPTAKLVPPKQAVGKYLDEPVLHYTPGTRVNSKVLANLQKFGIKDVHAHDEQPDFEPEHVRSVLSVYHDPDWQTRLAGFYTSSAFQKSVHRGAESDANSTSYFPALAKGVGFGKNLTTTGTYGAPAPFDNTAAR